MIRRFTAHTSRALRRQSLRVATDDGGATAIEYALLAGMIALVIIGALGELGGALRALPLPALIDAFQSVLS